MNEAIDRAANIFDEPSEVEQLEKLRALIPQLESDQGAQTEFIDTLRKMLDPDGSQAGIRSSDDAPEKFFKGNQVDIFENAKLAAPASTADSVLPGAPEAGDGPLVDALLRDPAPHVQKRCKCKNRRS